MNLNQLYRNVLITLSIGVPLCIFTPRMGMPLIMEFILLPIGIILSLVGIASSILLIQHKDLKKCER